MADSNDRDLFVRKKYNNGSMYLILKENTVKWSYIIDSVATTGKANNDHDLSIIKYIGHVHLIKRRL